MSLSNSTASFNAFFDEIYSPESVDNLEEPTQSCFETKEIETNCNEFGFVISPLAPNTSSMFSTPELVQTSSDFFLEPISFNQDPFLGETFLTENGNLEEPTQSCFETKEIETNCNESGCAISPLTSSMSSMPTYPELDQILLDLGFQQELSVTTIIQKTNPIHDSLVNVSENDFKTFCNLNPSEYVGPTKRKQREFSYADDEPELKRLKTKHVTACEESSCIGENEIRLTFHVRQNKNSPWDMGHSIASFHKHSRIGKYRKCLLASSIETFQTVVVQLVDANGTEIQEENPIFQLCSVSEDPSEDTSPHSCLSFNKKRRSFEFCLLKLRHDPTRVVFLRIRTETASSFIEDSIPLLSGGHKYPTGKKQIRRLRTVKQALVAKGGQTQFALQEFSDEALTLSMMS